MASGGIGGLVCDPTAPSCSRAAPAVATAPAKRGLGGCGMLEYLSCLRLGG